MHCFFYYCFPTPSSHLLDPPFLSFPSYFPFTRFLMFSFLFCFRHMKDCMHPDIKIQLLLGISASPISTNVYACKSHTKDRNFKSFNDFCLNPSSCYLPRNHKQVSTQKTDVLQSTSKEQGQDEEDRVTNHSAGTLNKSLQLPVPYKCDLAFASVRGWRWSFPNGISFFKVWTTPDLLEDDVEGLTLERYTSHKKAIFYPVSSPSIYSASIIAPWDF